MLAISLPAIAQEQKEFRINKNLTIYNDVMRQLDLNYVDTLNYDQLVKMSIDAMLSKLDPYTVYLPEDKTEDLQFMTTGAYGGIGAVISQRNGKSYITDPYEGMPAQRNDVRAGDIILEIDGKTAKGRTLNEVSNMLRGKPHDKIRLKLERYGEKKPIIKEFERETIQINPIGYASIVANGIGYIQLNDFTDKAATEFKAAVNKMVQSDSIHALIIDLRDNGGGIIDEAIKIVGYFVPKGTEVVSTKGKLASTERVYKTTTEPIYPDMKLAVLINRASASASEIVAGAMQDLDRAVLIGERTFGKGLVQNIRPISYDGHLKITTAKYYIPSGRCIQQLTLHTGYRLQPPQRRRQRRPCPRQPDPRIPHQKRTHCTRWRRHLARHRHQAQRGHQHYLLHLYPEHALRFRDKICGRTSNHCHAGQILHQQRRLQSL